MAQALHLSYLRDHLLQLTVPLPASKSESNRALIMAALSGAGQSLLSNISEARDTQTMLRLLAEEGSVLDVIDAGTTMRFLTAYCAITNQHKTLTGTARMCQRPIGILTDALQELGANIGFEQEAGFPPLHIKGFTYSGTKRLKVPGHISSQYISALLMIAPTLPDGLTLELTGTVNSQPYISMTLSLMEHFGIKSHWNKQNHVIEVAAQTYRPQPYTIESDWSAAGYWYSMAALRPGSRIRLSGLRSPDKSRQGDSRLAPLMQKLGVQTTFDNEGALLESRIDFKNTDSLLIHFDDIPDQAQTFFVLCAAKGVELQATGLESLRIKETDRIAALQEQLAKTGHRIEESTKDGKGFWKMTAQKPQYPKNLTINTYDDHRMAMAFAPLALQTDVVIEEPEVVKKSYPSFWKHLRAAGFMTSENE